MQTCPSAVWHSCRTFFTGWDEWKKLEGFLWRTLLVTLLPTTVWECFWYHRRVILYSEATWEAFFSCKDSLIPWTCESICFSKPHFFQTIKADTLDILWPSLNLCLKMVVNSFIPPPTSLAHAARNSQLHKDTYNISTPWRSFPLHGAKYCHHTHRTWDGEGMDVPWHSFLHSAKQSMAIQRGTVQGSEFMWSLGLFSLEKRRDLTAFTTSSQMEAEGQAVISSLWWSVTGPEEMARSCVRGVWIEY